MKQKHTQPLIPKLRFPEFRDAGEWEEKALNEFCEINPSNGGLPDSFFYIDLESVEEGHLSSPKRIKLEDAPSRAQRLLGKGDIIYQTVRPYQRNNLLCDFVGESDFVASTGYAQLRAHRSNLFLYQLLHTDSFVNKVLEKCTGSNYPAINSSDLAEIIVLFPADDFEQQKIADCLSSVDELIAAHGRKLAALQDHKKGLMQQLFPRKGETQPRLRFPEFQNAGEWINDSLGEIFDTSSGGTPDRAKGKYWNGNIPWITTSLVNFNIITRADEFISDVGLKNSSAKIFPAKTILIAMYGQGKTRGQVAMLEMDAATNQACAAILPRKDIDPHFVFLNLCSRYEEMRGLSNSGGQKNLSQGLIQELQFSYPDDIQEQQAIIAGLSALDDQIAAQSDKIAALRQHKKGLMQQLFPSKVINEER